MSANKQKKGLARKKAADARNRRLRKLKEKPAWTTFVPSNAHVVREAPGLDKMSEVLFEFVEPYMDMAPTEELLNRLLMLGVIAWNAATAPPGRRDQFLEKMVASFPPELREDGRLVLQPLIERKLEHFAGIPRFILNFELTMGPSSSPHLQVLSTLTR